MSKDGHATIRGTGRCDVAIDKHAILRHFLESRNGRTGGSRLLYDAASCLLCRILREHDFEDLRALRRYCADTNHLRPWLSARTDRVIFAEALCEDIRDYEMSASCRGHGRYRAAKARAF